MFTGVVTHIGTFTKKDKEIFTFQSNLSFVKNLKPGGSIAIDGCCLSVIKQPTADLLSVQIMEETMKRTTFGNLQSGDKVNLELPLSLNDRFEGHIVQGHIDSTGVVEEIKSEENSTVIRVTIPSHISQYIVEKGSITVNGVSLTTISAAQTTFSVGIIPFTNRHTTFQYLKIGSRVNIEVDILAKYVKSLLSKIV